MSAEELAAFLRRFDGAEKVIPAFLALAKRYEETPRETIINSLNRLFEPYMSRLRYRYANKYRIISAITDVSRVTVEAWFNDGRMLKIPLVHLSKIADRLGVPVGCLLDENGSWCDEDTLNQVTRELWKIEDTLINGGETTMECYGYELAGTKSGKHKLVVYKTLEAARKDAEALSAQLEADETLILFSAPCDENGKLVSNKFKILEAWGK